MTSPIQIWTSAAHHPAFRCGGWASLRLGQGPTTGHAGGARNTTAARMALAGLVSALRDLPARAGSAPHAPITIHTTSPDLASWTGFLASLSQPTRSGAAPEEDLDLWAQISTTSKGYQLSLARTPLLPDTPIAFAAAWAELAMDKAKAAGPFTAPIPKPNLAKIRF